MNNKQTIAQQALRELKENQLYADCDEVAYLRAVAGTIYSPAKGVLICIYSDESVAVITNRTISVGFQTDEQFNTEL